MTALLGFLADLFDRLPRWSQPAVGGALVLAAVVLLRAFPALLMEPERASEVSVVAGAAALGGAIGGLIFHFLGRPLGRIPRIGAYLTGIVTMGAYLTTLALLIPWIEPEAPRFFGNAFGVALFVLGVLGYGAMIGRSWFSEPAMTFSLPPRPTAEQRRAFRRERARRRLESKSAGGSETAGSSPTDRR